jgi:hypothetical protein
MRSFCAEMAKQTRLTLEVAAAMMLRDERRRWLLVSESNRHTIDLHRKMGELFARISTSLAKNGAGSSPKETQFRALGATFNAVAAGDSDLLRSHVICSSPFVGFIAQRLCVRVTKLFLVRRLPLRTERFRKKDCESFALEPGRAGAIESIADPSTPLYAAEAVSLDNPFLLIQVPMAECEAMCIDHRACCATWEANILHVARHRGDLVSQSFCAARDALPCNESTSPLVLMCNDYRYPDLYAALVRSSPCVNEKLLLVDSNLAHLPQKMLAAFPKPRTFLGDLVVVMAAGTKSKKINK